MGMRLKWSTVLVCAGLVACANEESAPDAQNEDITLDVATEISALEVDEDGRDEEFGDATEDGPLFDRECSLRDRKDAVLARYDIDGDGSLGDEEREALREDFGGGARVRHAIRHHRRAMMVRLYDADRSGALDADERAELRADLEARLAARKAQRLAKFDLDQSGDLDQAEWEAFTAHLRARFEAHHAKVLAEFDVNEDGKLDLEERFTARLALREKLEARRAAIEAELDTNGDGRLDRDERAVLVEELKARVRGEHFRPL